jgi:hypothetical protein
MVLHEGVYRELTIPIRRPSCDTHWRDLVDSDRANLGREGEIVMVRMFRRLLRGGAKQRVVGAWIL